jgi:hypothetical protein
MEMDLAFWVTATAHHIPILLIVIVVAISHLHQLTKRLPFFDYCSYCHVCQC